MFFATQICLRRKVGNDLKPVICNNATGCFKKRISGNLWQCHSFVVMRADLELQSTQEWWICILKVNIAHVCSFL